MSHPQAPYETDHVGATEELGLGYGAEHSAQENERVPTVEEIAREAYSIYLERGSQDGHDLEHWLEAEKRLIAQHRSRMAQQADAVVQHTNGETRQISARPLPDRRRNPRQSAPIYLPV